MTSYGIKLRLPIYEAGGLTIAVTLCQADGHHFGILLTRDSLGKDPKRPRYLTGCAYTKPDTGSARFVARLADLGDDLHNLTFNGQLVRACWRTIYVVPTASESHSGTSAIPSLIMNCNPASHFRFPRWLIARLIALQFRVVQTRDSAALQVINISHPSGLADIRILLGSCTETSNRDSELVRPVELWAKADVRVSHIGMETFQSHDCSKDHLNSESWNSHSKTFGDTGHIVQLSLTHSTRMTDSVLVVHLELLGDTFEKLLQEAGYTSLFPSLGELEKDAQHPTPAHNLPDSGSYPEPHTHSLSSGFPVSNTGTEVNESRNGRNDLRGRLTRARLSMMQAKMAKPSFSRRRSLTSSRDSSSDSSRSFPDHDESPLPLPNHRAMLFAPEPDYFDLQRRETLLSPFSPQDDHLLTAINGRPEVPMLDVDSGHGSLLQSMHKKPKESTALHPTQPLSPTSYQLVSCPFPGTLEPYKDQRAFRSLSLCRLAHMPRLLHPRDPLPLPLHLSLVHGDLPRFSQDRRGPHDVAGNECEHQISDSMVRLRRDLESFRGPPQTGTQRGSLVPSGGYVMFHRV